MIKRARSGDNDGVDPWPLEEDGRAAGADRRAKAPAEPRETRLRRVLETQLDLAARTLRTYGVSEADVDDGIQHVSLVLADKIDRIEPGAERAFVFRTAQRIASRIRRTLTRRREVPEPQTDQRQDLLSPELIADERQAMDALGRVLDSLDEELREVFVLYEVEEMTMAAIAQTLELPPGTVASRLRRARERFQDLAGRFRHEHGGDT